MKFRERSKVELLIEKLAFACYYIDTAREKNHKAKTLSSVQ